MKYPDVIGKLMRRHIEEVMIVMTCQPKMVMVGTRCEIITTHILRVTQSSLENMQGNNCVICFSSPHDLDTFV